MRLRFAPSPTGFLHVGNARIALFNYLFARKHGGIFILRIDDTSSESSSEFERYIREDLLWLGLNWDEELRQSDRQGIYLRYFELLREKGLVYPCFCTKEQLEVDRKKALSEGRPPRYVGRCRNLSEEERQRLIALGKPHCWRFKVPQTGVVFFEDLVKGRARFECRHLGDFVIRRSDGSFLYMFTSAVDDGLLGITHVFRGEDHFSNTPFQILIMEALGFDVPSFAHFPLLVDKDGKPFSKRNHPPSLRELKKEGFLPEAVNLFLFNLGRKEQLFKALELGSLVELFDPADYGSSRTVCSEEHLIHCNRVFIRGMDLAKLKRTFLEYCDQEDTAILDNFLELFRENANTLSELCDMYKKVVLGRFEPPKVDEQGKRALILFAESMDVDYVLEKIEISRGRFFKLLRLVLTGLKHGPPLAEVLKFLGKDRVVERIKVATEGSHGN